MGMYSDERDAVVSNEPIMPLEKCRLEITFVERNDWTSKAEDHKGEKFPALKVTYKVIDERAETESKDANVKAVEDVLNLTKFPYTDKTTGETKYLRRGKLFDLERALGFEPVFVDESGKAVEPRVSKRNGNKYGPKGSSQTLNTDFEDAYFDAGGNPKVDNWIDKEVLADIDIERNEEFGDRNKVKRIYPVS